MEQLDLLLYTITIPPSYHEQKYSSTKIVWEIGSMQLMLVIIEGEYYVEVYIEGEIKYYCACDTLEQAIKIVKIKINKFN